MYYLYYGNSFKEGGAVGLIGFPVGGNIDEIQCVKIEKHTFISLMILLHLKIAKMAIFLKKHSFAILRCHKIAKMHNIKRVIPCFISGAPSNIYTSFCLNSSIFQRLVTFFVRSRGSSKRWKKYKNACFFGKNSGNFWQ